MKAIRLFFALFLGIVFDSSAGAPPEAPSLVVTITADIVNNMDHQTSLREALAYATSLGGAQVITFAPALTAAGPATILLGQTGDNTYGPSALLVSTNVTILGPVQTNGITIARDTAPAAPTRLRLFYINGTGNLTLHSVTLSGGVAKGGDSASGGGGLGAGGAIVNSGTLTIFNSLLVNHTARGGSSGVGGNGSGGGGMGEDAPLLGGGTGGGPNGGPAGQFLGLQSGGNGGLGGGGGAGYSFGGVGGFGGGGGCGFTFANFVTTALGGGGGFGGGGGGVNSSGSGGYAGLYGGNGPVAGAASVSTGGGGAGLGGAVFNYGGSVTILNSTITGNAAIGGNGGSGAQNGSGLGGAVFSVNGSVNILQSTLSGNVAAQGGRGLYLSTIDPSVGGSANVSALATIINSILGQGDNSIPDVLFGRENTAVWPSTSGNNNLIRNATVPQPFNAFAGTSSSADPQLGSLGPNGGPTRTIALRFTSPALNAGDTTYANNLGLAFDQRGSGFARVGFGIVDIGAFEGVRANPDIAVAAPADLTSGVSTVDLGIVNLGSSGTARTFTITNVGTDPLTIMSITKTGSDTADFALDTANILNSVPAFGGSTTFTVTFTPGAAGLRSMTLHIGSDDVDEGSFDIPITGTGNTIPLAPNGTDTATTGDPKTITLPASDADGDTLRIDSLTFDDDIFALDSTNGLDVTLIVATNYVGDATVGYTVIDGKGGVASGTITVTISDNDKPTIGPPSGGFTPLVTYAGTLPDYRDLAMKSDNVGVVYVTQNPQEGSATVPGDVLVTLTAHDDAGNTADTSFTVTIRPVNAVNAKLLAVGETAPGAGTNGLPADALLTSFGPPATDDGGNIAFLAKWTSATGGKGAGLFLNDACLGIVGGDAPIVGAKYKSFTDPVVDGGKVVCIAALTGTPKPPATVVLGNLASQTALEVIAQAGGVATADGAKFKAFKAVAVSDEYVGVFAQLAIGTGTAPKTTAANDLGLWIKDGSGPLTLALREGQEIAGGRIIKTLVSFVPGAGSPGQGRGWLSSRPAVGGKVLALALFTDKTQGVLAVDAGDLANTIPLSVTNQGDTGPNLSGATFTGYGLPTLVDDGTSAFLATMTGSGAGVTKANARGVFIKSALESNYDIVVRTGDDAISGAKFAAFKDPVLSGDGVIAFSATLKGGTVKGLGTTTLCWQRPGDALTLLAQGGAATVGDLPDARWKAFTSLAIAGGGRGPIFAATLVPDQGGVTAKNATGVWATDFTDATRLLFRTDDKIDVNGTMKTLKSFTLLKATVGSTGVTRSFNDAAQVVWLATFTDKTSAIVTTEVP